MFRRLYSNPLQRKSSLQRGRFFLYSGLFAVSSAVGYTTDILSLDTKDVPVGLPRDAPDAQKYIHSLQHKLDRLPLIERLRKDSNYIESAAWEHSASDSTNSIRRGTMTSGILSTIGGLSIAPRVFVNKEDKSIVAVVHYGFLLTGLLFFAHGGILGTLLDDALARTGGLSMSTSTEQNGLPSRTQYGQTQSLSIIYKKPTPVNQFLVIRTSTDSQQGSIVHVSGSIQSLDNQTLVKASANIDVSTQRNIIPPLSSWRFW